MEGLDVDSDDGWATLVSTLAKCSSSVAGSSVGISISVFRVILSVSGLTTFDIAGCSAIPNYRG
jgi:hypothetical protein